MERTADSSKTVLTSYESSSLNSLSVFRTQEFTDSLPVRIIRVHPLPEALAVPRLVQVVGPEAYRLVVLLDPS